MAFAIKEFANHQLQLLARTVQILSNAQQIHFVLEVNVHKVCLTTLTAQMYLRFALLELYAQSIKMGLMHLEILF